MGRSRTPAAREGTPVSPADKWTALIGPALLITLMGAVAVLFLYSCARKSELELHLRQAEQRLEKTQAQREQLCSAISAARDPVRLRETVGALGLTYTPAALDHLALQEKLPPEEWAISPVAGLPPAYPAQVIRPPVGAVARAPGAGLPGAGHGL